MQTFVVSFKSSTESFRVMHNVHQVAKTKHRLRKKASTVSSMNAHGSGSLIIPISALSTSQRFATTLSPSLKRLSYMRLAQLETDM